MKSRLFILTVMVALALGVIACNQNGANTNVNANANTNTAGPITVVTPVPTPKGTYSEEQAREERARAKENKETIGEALDDAWIHAKIVAKLIGDSKTPERKINVDVVKGVVTLRGTVDTAEAKTEAERTAKGTEGVKSVRNQLKVVASKPANTNKSTNTSKSKIIYD